MLSLRWIKLYSTLIICLTFLNNCKSSRRDLESSLESAEKKGKAGDILPENGNWPSIRAEREADYQTYFSSPSRAKAANWYQSQPLGVNGVPYLVLRALMQMYPDIWTPQNGSFGDFLGFPPHPEDYEGDAVKGFGGNLKPASQRHAVPFGFVTVKDFTNDSSSVPGSENTFFSCAGCHTSRVMYKGKVKFLFGGANTEVEPQMYGALLYRSGMRLSNVATEPDLKKIEPNKLEVAKLWRAIKNFDCSTYKTHLPDRGQEECNSQKKILLEGEKDPGTAATGGTLVVGEEEETTAPSFIGQVQGLLNKSGNFTTVVKNLLGSAAKAKIQLYTLGEAIPYASGGKSSNPSVASSLSKPAPPIVGPRPGQMDAFGLVQGIIYMNAMRPDLLMFRSFPNNRNKILPSGYANGDENTADYKLGESFAGSQEQMVRSSGPTGTWNSQLRSWYTQAAALSDIKSLWYSRDEYHANWDGNQGAHARVLASGTSAVGDPAKVYTEIHEYMNSFINDLPSPAYPFDDVDQDPEFYKKALLGQTIFKESCESCHRKQNQQVYNVGSDMNRAHVIYSPMTRLGLVTLTQAACDYGKQRELLREKAGVPRMDGQPAGSNKRYWCEQNLGSPSKDRDDMMHPYRGANAGYKADALHGIWADGPFLHNGSVPNLRELFGPAIRRSRQFIRGNINFDVKNVGFVNERPTKSGSDQVSPSGQYQHSDSMHYATFNTGLRGNSNIGHEFFHRNLQVGPNGKVVAGREWTEEEREAMIAYMKTR